MRGPFQPIVTNLRLTKPLNLDKQQDGDFDEKLRVNFNDASLNGLTLIRRLRVKVSFETLNGRINAKGVRFAKKNRAGVVKVYSF